MCLCPAHTHAHRHAQGVGSGCTIHLVTEKYDEGPVLDHMEVPVKEGDTAEILASRVFEAECQLLPSTLVAMANGEISLTDATRGIR